MSGRNAKPLTLYVCLKCGTINIMYILQALAPLPAMVSTETAIVVISGATILAIRAVRTMAFSVVSFRVEHTTCLTLFLAMSD